METRPHQPVCASDPYAAYEAMYESLLAVADREEFLAHARARLRCCRVRDDCALAQALADVTRGVPKRQRTELLWTLLVVQLESERPG
jgi:hypothetical protein